VRVTDQEIREFISLNTWAFAKTMPKTPHWYALRRKASDEKQFENFVMEIRRRGYAKRFGGREYKYLDVDGFTYWTMGSPLDQTILINRAQIKEDSGDTAHRPARGDVRKR
jgi:hypothetical protein